MNDYLFMQWCTMLAARGRKRTEINPMVGAVLVREGEIIAEGWHEEFGAPHAETMLLEKIEQKISSTDTLYVNLEPCCHEGKTPPCTEAIIQSGIKEVVIGMLDPSPKVSGKGIEALRKAGITVRGPVLQEVCERLNRGFISLHKSGRPWITLKKAQTSDGKVNNANGSKLCITTDDQNAWSHTHLRNELDAILVGVSTIISDDPELTIRHGDEYINQPLRIILDPHQKIPIDAKVVGPGTLVITSEEPSKELLDKGVWMETVAMDGDHFDWNQLWKLLITPKENFNGITSILVEGGPKTWETFKNDHILDEEVILLG